MDVATVVIITILGGIGATLCFVGALFTIVTAFGNKQYVWGIASILLLPVTILYCALHWSRATYAARLLYSGCAMLILCLIPSVLF